MRVNSDTGEAGSFLDIEFSRMEMAATIDWILTAMAGDRFRYVVTPNVDHVVKLHSGEAGHPAFNDAVRSADLRINDSRILRRLASLSGIDLPVVPGSDLTGRLITNGLPADSTVVLIGGSSGDLKWLRANLAGTKITQHQPPMAVLRDPAIQRRIVEFVETERPNLTLFAFGAPQSEIVAHQIQQRAAAPGVGLCIGASVEFLTGAKRRAPKAMQRLGLEWAFRLLSEPKRMWRRYLVEGPKIFAIWQKWTVRQRMRR